jgi:hypothetical protein
MSVRTMPTAPFLPSNPVKNRRMNIVIWNDSTPPDNDLKPVARRRNSEEFLFLPVPVNQSDGKRTIHGYPGLPEVKRCDRDY